MAENKRVELKEMELENVNGGFDPEPGDYVFVKGTKNFLPLRKTPHASKHNIVYKLHNNDCVKFIRRAENGYVLVDLVDGSEPGYVLAEYLE